MQTTGSPWALFAISSVLLLIFIVRGDDDFAEKLLLRKPTPDEAVRRLRYGLARLFAALSGGSILSTYLVSHINEMSHLLHSLSSTNRNFGDGFVIAVFILCSFVVLTALRIAQNFLRKVQGRKPRPWIDIQTLKLRFFGRNR